MTRRVVKALRNRFVSILAHPTTRLLGERDPVDLDLEQVYQVARENQTALEINCYSRRLDLNDAQARRAREVGVKLVLSTDTHVLSQLDDIDLGLALARRAWAGPKDLLNTMGMEELMKWVALKREGGGADGRSV